MWQLIRIDLGLDQARIGSQVWWRQMVPRPSGAIVVSASVYRGDPSSRVEVAP